MLLYVKPFNLGQPKSGDLHVLSFNAMMGFKMVSDRHITTPDIHSKIDGILHQKPAPSIACIQEASILVKKIFKQSFSDYHIHTYEDRASAIYSQYEIHQAGQVDFGSKWKSCLWADILVENGDTIRVYNVHLESNRLNPRSYEYLTAQGVEIESLSAVNGVKDLLVKYPWSAEQRARQAEKVREHVLQSPYPVIVSGDLNDPPMSYTYKTIKKGLNDSFLTCGRGIGTTWRSSIPMLRIDYIFASDHFDGTNFKILKSDISDHYPVKASFSLIDNKKGRS